MRYIVREVGKYEPIFDQDIGDKNCMYSEKNIDVAYISNDTDLGDAVVINLYSTKNVYVKVESMFYEDQNIFTITKT